MPIAASSLQLLRQHFRQLARAADAVERTAEDYELLRAQFSDKEMADLTVAIILVNGWNRLGVGFRRQPAD